VIIWRSCSCEVLCCCRQVPVDSGSRGQSPVPHTVHSVSFSANLLVDDG
jgi:hypothetical protein